MFRKIPVSCEEPKLTRLILGSGFQPDYVREIANAYARIGYDVRVIGGDMHRGCVFEKGVEFLNLRGKDTRETSRRAELGKLARYYFRLLRTVVSSPSKVVYDVSIGRPFLRCLLMYTAFRLLGVKIIYTAHNVLPHDRKTLLNKSIYWVIYRCLTNAIVVHGDFLKSELVRQFRVRPDKVNVIHHGTYRPAQNPAITKASARASLGLSDDARVLLIFGYQRPYKGTHCVLKQLRETPIPEVVVLLRGEATDSSYQTELNTLCLSMPPRCWADAVFGAVPEDKVETLFKACDIVLLPYLDGSQSGVKYMAYAHGRPVLASALGSLGEGIKYGITGEVFTAGDFADFRAVLARMLESLPNYDEAQIKHIAYTEFSFEAAAAQVEAVHQDLTRTAPALEAQEEESA